jgi:hypothetical protein
LEGDFPPLLLKIFLIRRNKILVPETLKTVIQTDIKPVK